MNATPWRLCRVQPAQPLVQCRPSPALAFTLLHPCSLYFFSSALFSNSSFKTHLQMISLVHNPLFSLLFFFLLKAAIIPSSVILKHCAFGYLTTFPRLYGSWSICTGLLPDSEILYSKARAWTRTLLHAQYLTQKFYVIKAVAACGLPCQTIPKSFLLHPSQTLVLATHLSVPCVLNPILKHCKMS